MNNKIFIIGSSSSVLIRQRVAMLMSMGVDLTWYSQSKDRVSGLCVYSKLVNQKLLGSLIELVHVLFLLAYIRPSVIHVFYAKNRWLNLVLALHPCCVVTVMGSDISEATVKAGTMNFLLVKLLLKRAIIITSKSAYMDKMLQRFSISVPKLQRVTWGVDINKFALNLDSTELRRKLVIAGNAHVFFSIRACKPLYQHERVLFAFSRFISTHGEGVLLISTMGAVPSYLTKLEKLAAEYSITDNVIFLPTISSDEMPLYYNLADAVVSIPLSDGMPQSLYESMACGCFHILGNLPQYREVVTAGESGLFVDIENESSLVDAFAWVIKHGSDLELLGPSIRASILPLIDRDIQQGVISAIYAKLIQFPLQAKE